VNWWVSSPWLDSLNVAQAYIALNLRRLCLSGEYSPAA
jgi:hypothetical protein